VTARGTLKTRLAIAAALLVTLFVGRLWGASGRWELNQLLQRQFTGFSAGIDEAPQLAARLSQGADRAAGVQGSMLPVKISEKPWGAANRRSLAVCCSCDSSQAVQRTAKGSARSLGSAISPSHSAQ